MSNSLLDALKPNPIRAGIGLAFTGLWTAFFFFVTYGALVVPPRGGLSNWIVRRIWAPGLLGYYRVRVRRWGLENLDPTRTYLFVSNHQSLFDVLAIFQSVPTNLRFVAKRELLYVPFFGPYLWAAGFPLIDRSNRNRAIRSLEEAAERIRNGIAVVTFPEGTRSPDGEVQQFKKGPFMLALKARVPIVPVSITGSSQVLPKKSLAVRPGTIHVHYGQPIAIDDYTLEDRDRLMAEVHQAIVRDKAELERRLAAGEEA